MAFIQFSDPNEAVLAYQELDGIDLQGRLMHIIPGEQKRMGKDDNLEGKTLKERREIERRQQAGRGGDWGTLFMNVLILLLSSIVWLANFYSKMLLWRRWLLDMECRNQIFSSHQIRPQPIQQ